MDVEQLINAPVMAYPSLESQSAKSQVGDEEQKVVQNYVSYAERVANAQKEQIKHPQP